MRRAAAPVVPRAAFAADGRLKRLVRKNRPFRAGEAGSPLDGDRARHARSDRPYEPPTPK